jgi:hypothetical protein
VREEDGVPFLAVIHFEVNFLFCAISQIETLSPKAERCGQGGGGAQVGRTTLLDAADPDGVSGDRSYREQPAGAPGRRKLDRRTDWALSHPAPGGMFA